MLKFQYYLLLINIIYTKINIKNYIKTNIKIIIKIKILFITNIKIFTHPFKIIFSFFIFITFIKLIHNKFDNL